MRQITVNLYSYGELGEKAKAAARDWFRYSSCHDWSDEIKEVEAIASAFDMKADWSVSTTSHSYVEFIDDLSDEVLELEGVRAVTYVCNNFITPNQKGKFYVKRGMDGKCMSTRSKATLEDDCSFTGYYLGCNVMEAYNWMQIEIKLGKKVTVADFIRMVGDMICRDWLSEMEARETDEYAEEEIEINGYEFFEDGSIAKVGA